MAVDVDKASSQYYSVGSVLGVTDYPFTCACWCRPDGVVGRETLFSQSRTAVNDQYVTLELDGGAPQVARASSSSSGSAAAGAALSAGVWGHVAGVFTSSALMAVYLNGLNPGTDTTAVTYSLGANPSTALGALIDSGGVTRPYGGWLAEVAMWTAALTVAEIASLAAGISPLLIRPQSLVEYWQGLRHGATLPGRRGTALTNVSGGATADHPRVYLPNGPL